MSATDVVMEDSNNKNAENSAAAAAAETNANEPVVMIVLGMAGSGKTTLVQRIIAEMNAQKKAAYCINLDPAVGPLPFGVNIDIRDTVNYKEVMKQYALGPNGGIITALNLFATRFDQVLSLVEKRAPTLDYVVVDTPGQIEVFTWSASGKIITEAIASSLPTVYVVDTPRTTSPSTFISNMLYACSILYKTQLPFILAFNKTDVQSADHAKEWMQDYTSFQNAIDADESYAGTLARSMALLLDEFYVNLPFAAVSAVTGDGIADFFEKVQAGKQEFLREYRPNFKKRKEEMEKKAASNQKAKDIEARLRKTKGHDLVNDEGSTAQFVGPHHEYPGELLDSEDGDSSDDDADDDDDDDDEEEEDQRTSSDMMEIQRALADIASASPNHPIFDDSKEVAERELDNLRKQVALSRVDGSMDVLD